MYSFKYINPIRDINGKLREWKDYNYLSKLENTLDNADNYWGNDRDIKYKHRFIENERSKIQR